METPLGVAIRNDGWEEYPDLGSDYDDVPSDVEQALLQQFHYASTIRVQSTHLPVIEPSRTDAVSCGDGGTRGSMTSVVDSKMYDAHSSMREIPALTNGINEVKSYICISSDEDDVSKFDVIDIDADDDDLEGTGKGNNRRKLDRLKGKDEMFRNVVTRAAVLDSDSDDEHVIEGGALQERTEQPLQDSIIGTSSAKATEFHIASSTENSVVDAGSSLTQVHVLEVTQVSGNGRPSFDIPTMIDTVFSSDPTDETVGTSLRSFLLDNKSTGVGATQGLDDWNVEADAAATTNLRERYWADPDAPATTMNKWQQNRMVFEQCFVCREGGHMGRDCPNRESAICDACGFVGHRTWCCPIEVCSRCQQFGHNRRNCKNPSTQGDEYGCLRCRCFGHVHTHCPDLYKRYLKTNKAQSQTVVKINDVGTIRRSSCSWCAGDHHTCKCPKKPRNLRLSAVEVQFLGDSEAFFHEKILKSSALVSEYEKIQSASRRPEVVSHKRFDQREERTSRSIRTHERPPRDSHSHHDRKRRRTEQSEPDSAQERDRRQARREEKRDRRVAKDIEAAKIKEKEKKEKKEKKKKAKAKGDDRDRGSERGGQKADKTRGEGYDRSQTHGSVKDKRNAGVQSKRGPLIGSDRSHASPYHSRNHSPTPYQNTQNSNVFVRNGLTLPQAAGSSRQSIGYQNPNQHYQNTYTQRAPTQWPPHRSSMFEHAPANPGRRSYNGNAYDNNNSRSMYRGGYKR